jgi:predicted PurR-regulated permease PerM
VKPSPDPYTRRVIVAVALGAFAFILWQLRDVLPLLFGGIIVATALRALADAVSRVTPLPARAALVGVVVALLGVAGVGVWLIGAQLAGQLAGLWQAWPQAFDAAAQWIGQTPFASVFAGTWQSIEDAGVPWLRVAGAAGVATNGLLTVVLIVALGLYLAHAVSGRAPAATSGAAHPSAARQAADRQDRTAATPDGCPMPAWPPSGRRSSIRPLAREREWR